MSQPLALLDLPCAPSDGQALTLALFVQRQPSHRQRQLTAIRTALGEQIAGAVEGEAERLHALGGAQRLPQLMSVMNVLQELDVTARERLLSTVDAMVRADGRVSLTEYVFARLLRDALAPRPLPYPAVASPAELRHHCAVLLSVVARAGHHREALVSSAFRRGAACAPLDGIRDRVPAEAMGAEAIDRALDTLAGTSQPFRDALVHALAEVAWHDGEITVVERELLHTLGAALRVTVAQRLADNVAGDNPAGDDRIAVGGSAVAGGAAGGLALLALHDDRPQRSVKDEAALLIDAPASSADEPVWSERDRLPVQALLVANLIPLGGVVFFGWDARNLLLLYWLENLVVGGYTLVRMLHVGGLRVLFPAAFFTFHYSFFCAGHGVVIMALAALAAGEGEAGDHSPDIHFEEGWGPLMPFELLWNLFRWIAVHAPGMLMLPFLAFVVSHGISTLVHHFIGKEYVGRKAEDIMFDPYRRIAALHIAILAGSFLIVGSGGGSLAPALAVLIAIKIAIDLHQHRRAHRGAVEV